jgi:hypothetical protein
MPIDMDRLDEIARVYIAPMTSIRGPHGKTATTSYDLHKDSLPVVGRATSKQDLGGILDSLEITVSSGPRSQHKQVRELLRRVES